MPIVVGLVTRAQVGTMALTCQHVSMDAPPTLGSTTVSLVVLASFHQHPHALAGMMVLTFHLASMPALQMRINSDRVFLAVLISFLLLRFEFSMHKHSDSFCPSKLLFSAAGLD